MVIPVPEDTRRRVYQLVEQLKVHWSSQGIAPPAGVSEERLHRFEMSCGLCLPPELRLYFSLINGMGRCDAMDDNLFSFYDLDSVEASGSALTKDELLRYPMLVDRYIVATNSFGLPHYCINCSKYGTFGSIGALYKQDTLRYLELCGTFSEFLELYLSGRADDLR